MEPALDTTLGHSIDDFLASLESAIKWCSWRLKHSTNPDMLRSLELRPWSLAGSRKEIVGSVVSERASLARSISFDSSESAALQADWLDQLDARPAWAQSINLHSPLKGGRLMLYAPDDTCLIGLAQSETHGYFDSTDTPPWDTWVAWIEEPPHTNQPQRLRYLVSWVAHEHLELAHAGIDVSPTACIRWLDKEPCNLRELLRSRGFL